MANAKKTSSNNSSRLWSIPYLDRITKNHPVGTLCTLILVVAAVMAYSDIADKRHRTEIRNAAANGTPFRCVVPGGYVYFPSGTVPSQDSAKPLDKFFWRRVNEDTCKPFSGSLQGTHDAQIPPIYCKGVQILGKDLEGDGPRQRLVRSMLYGNNCSLD